MDKSKLLPMISGSVIPIVNYVSNETLYDDLRILQHWCSKNKIKVNASKTKYINFDFCDYKFYLIIIDQTRDYIPLPCHCEKIETVKLLKYLGLMFDDKFT